MTGALPLSGEPSGEYGGGASPSIDKGGADGKSGMEREHERGCKVAADRESEEKRKGLAAKNDNEIYRPGDKQDFVSLFTVSFPILLSLFCMHYQCKVEKKKINLFCTKWTTLLITLCKKM